MKTLKLTTTLFSMLFITGAAFGQLNENPPLVKILPHTEEGFVRLMYVGKVSAPVTIKFLNGEELITKDKVRASKFQRGFTKIYDVRDLESGEYTIQVKTEGLLTNHKFNKSKTEEVWASYWNNKLNNNMDVVKLDKNDSLTLTAGN